MAQARRQLLMLGSVAGGKRPADVPYELMRD
jgi:hypothetical protein